MEYSKFDSGFALPHWKSCEMDKKKKRWLSQTVKFIIVKSLNWGNLFEALISKIVKLLFYWKNDLVNTQRVINP